MENNQKAIEALGLIYQAARMAPLSAADHEKIVAAANVIKAALLPEEETKKKK